MKTYNGDVEITKENQTEWDKLKHIEKIDGDVIVYQGATITLPAAKQTGDVIAEQGATITLPAEAKILNQELRDILKKELRDEFAKEGYLLADGLLAYQISKRKQGEIIVYKTKSIGMGKIGYVVQRGEIFSHGETVKQAVHDLRYKLSDRDTTKYKGWTLDTPHPIADIIGAYRAITGACETGAKMFCEGKKIPEKMSVKTAIKATTGAWGADKFAKFFKKNGTRHENQSKAV